MRSPALLLALSSALLLASSARAADQASPPVLVHRSSIAAILAQGGTIGLTPDQVKLLEHADSVLAPDQDAARAAAAAVSDDGSRKAPDRPSGGGPASSGPGGMSGGKVRPVPKSKGPAPDPAALLEQQLDVLDTEAFLKAVEPFPEAQREKAIEIASRYREQVFELREKEKNR